MIAPAQVLVYSNRTSFTTLAPFVPVIPDLLKVDRCNWSTTVYGWFDTCTFHIPGVSPNQAYFWLEQCLGRMVRVKVLGSIAWEGLIYEVQAEMPAVTMTRSFVPMANKVYVDYSDNDTGAQTTTTASNDTDSQAKYGTKEIYLAGGTLSSTQAANERNRYKASNSLPQLTREFTDRPLGMAGVTVTAKGYYYTLNWRYYTSTTAGTQASATTIGDIATSKGDFLSSTQNLAATGRTLPRRFPNRATAWEQMLVLVDPGTSNDLKYFLGVKNNRVLTGWEEPITLSYLKHPRYPGVYFDSAMMAPLQYWQVVPGKWAQVVIAPADAMTVDNNNPRALLIGSCEYDAANRTVTPHYGVTMPSIARNQGKAGNEAEDPLKAPWSHWDAYAGYRYVQVNGRWVKQEMGWYRRGGTDHRPPGVQDNPPTGWPGA